LRVVIRTSKLAIYARRFGRVALPLIIIPVLLHRFRLMTSDVFYITLWMAAGAAVLAILLGLIALCRLWITGDHGWRRAFSGIFLGGIALLPFLYFGSLAMRYLPATDVATGARDAMPLMFDPGTASMPTPRLLLPEDMRAQYPNAEARTYPLGVDETYALVSQLVDNEGWEVRRERVPADGSDIGLLNAQITTLFGWREEAVILVTGTLTSSRVEMRSASLYAFHDFGSNGTRIENFLSSLDTAVTDLLRAAPEIINPADNEASAVAKPSAV
jgi:hypothetical protein